MKFKWKNAFFALAVAAAALALLAMIICADERNVAGMIVSGIAICIWAFVAAGLHDELESVDDDWSDWP
jgi:hypothetical protein